MKLPKYSVTISSDYHRYLFYSDGPRGKIAKAVIYAHIKNNLFNLSFGDWDEELQELDDSSRIIS